MADFRIQSLALGPYGTTAINTNATASLTKPLLLPQQDATPDITRGSYWLTENTSAVAITYFDGTLAGGVDGVEEGKMIVLLFRDSMTSIVNGAQMFLAKSGGAFLRNEAIALVHSNSAWYELMRSQNSQVETRVLNVGTTLGVNVDGVATLILNATAGLVLRSLSGGRLGQQVVIFSNSGGSAITMDTAGNLRIAGTDSLVMNTSAAYLAICRASNVWSVMRPPQTAA